MVTKQKLVIMLLTHDAIQPSLDVRVIKEAKSLVANGFKVTIVCRMDKPGKKTIDKYENINILRVHCPHPDLSSPRLLRLVHNFINSRIVYKKILELQPDVIHCNDLNTLLDGVAAGIRLKVPVVFDAHEDWVLLEYTHSGYSKLMYILTRIYQQILLAKVSYEIVSVAHQERQLPKGRSILLLNCPEKDFFKGADPRPIREKYNLNGYVVVTYHGGIYKEKGIIEMIEACEKLVKNYDNVKFMAIGHNWEPFKKIVEEKSLTSKFIFPGRIYHTKIHSFLKASDICWIIHRLSKQYVIGTPTKMYEGMLAGLPILGNSEFPGMVQVITKYKTGVTVNCDVDDIVKGLEILINNPAKRKKMGRNSKKAALKEFTWEKQVKKMIEAYHDLVSND